MLTGQTVLVTGGGTGIGREIALAFARQGCAVAVTGRRRAPLDHVRAEISALGAKALAVRADVAAEDSVRSLVQTVAGELGPVDILINNAAQFTHGPVVDLPVSEFDRVLATNLRGAFLMSQACLPAMIERRRGTIVMIGSTSGKRGDPGGAAYSASKFGLVGLSQSLFYEVRQHNVRVIMVYPSAVDTSVGPKKREEGRGARLCAEDVAQAILAAAQLPGRALVRELELWATNP